jgi:hypothetical protein
VTGNVANPFEVLYEIYTTIQDREQPSQEPEQDQVFALLPDASDLPAGYEMAEEVALGFSGEVSSGAAGESDRSREDLEATIAALEERVEQSEGGSSATQPDDQSLEILSVTTKDAGIGDGSMYAYVEVRNNSDQSYSYVGLEGTCRDASGGIVGTGLGNTTNVAPGSTVVITMILLQVSGCTDVEVRFDALTGLF